MKQNSQTYHHSQYASASGVSTVPPKSTPGNPGRLKVLPPKQLPTVALTTGGQATGVGNPGQVKLPVALEAAGVSLTVNVQLVKLVAIGDAKTHDAGRSSQWPYSLRLGNSWPLSASQALMLPGAGEPVMLKSTANQESSVVPSPSSRAMSSA